MKTKTLILYALLTCIFQFTRAQQQPDNGGFESWSSGVTQAPVGWGTNDQLFGGEPNRFVFKDSLPQNVSSGQYAVKLFSDTISYMGVDLAPGVIGYGSIYIPSNGPPQSTGLPFTGTPSSIGFSIKILHAVTDTAYWDYALTRWNNADMKEDTVAFGGSLFPDASYPMNQWFWASDSIRYLLPGQPDTLHVIILGGGKNNALRRGNTSWVDDVSVFYTATGWVSLDADEAVKVFPNPATNLLYIKSPPANNGTFVIMDASGKRLLSYVINQQTTVVNIANLPAGNYVYELTGSNNQVKHKGKFLVVK